jgi:hypothetical protein
MCGDALLAFDACNACRTPSTEFPWLKSLPIDADEVRYDLSDLEPLHRAALTDLLRHDNIAYRFESGILLVAATPDEDRVDEALSEVEAPAEEDLALAAAGDEEQAASDEAAMDALSALYRSADRLARHPDSSHAAADLDAAAAVVTSSEPPWGFDARLWARIGELSGQLRDQVDGGTLGDVMLAAEELRGLVRDHV